MKKQQRMVIDNPCISVLMPAYNAASYIKEAILSVLEQSFTSFELLVINDGSTDDTEKVVRSFSDPRIRFFEQSNRGVAAALNRGLSVASAPLIARFDADDICLPGRLKIQYDFMIAHPEYIIIGSDADFIDMEDNYVFTYNPPWHSNKDIQLMVRSKCPFIHSGVMYRKDAIVNAGGYNVHAHAFEDHLLWRKILEKGMACNIAKVLLKVRLNPASISIDEKWHHKRFIEIKNKSIEKGDISEEEGRELKTILNEQANRKIKEGAYYSLLGKKYLWNNYQPGKARNSLKKTLLIHPWNITSWGLLMLSYMPVNFIQKLYSWRR
ncbi:MAG: hypothetical protein JWP81_1283 [Ferruginibacter sp.]|nr:hypothetical protein [Ferruginibacter sp.]